MAITLRGDSQSGKGSALTHAELDANFTTLGLSHGDTVVNLATLTLKLTPTNYADLPSSPSRGDIAYLLFDGAATPAYQNQPIYYEGSQWQYFNGSPVATS